MMIFVSQTSFHSGDRRLSPEKDSIYLLRGVRFIIGNWSFIRFDVFWKNFVGIDQSAFENIVALTIWTVKITLLIQWASAICVPYQTE
jgi:hypothetical protein